MNERIEAAEKLLVEHGWERTGGYGSHDWLRHTSRGIEFIQSLGECIYGYIGSQPPGSGISNVEVIVAMFGPKK